MVQGVGGTGSSGSIKNISAYQTYYPMYQQYCQSNDSNIDFESWLIMKGYIKNFNQQVENYIETGDTRVGDESKNTIDGNAHVSNATGALYQSQDDETFYEFDWESGTYRTLTDKEQISKALGMPEDQNIDMIKLGYMNAEITDYTFGNLDDGQNKTNSAVYGKYGNVTYTQQEFDIHYILNALLMDPSDPQYQIAKGVFDDLCANTKQWLPDSEMEELNEIAAQYGTNSAEYKAKLQEVLLKNLDQAQEWVEDHTHVKNTGTIGSAEDATTNTDTTTDGTTEGSESTTGDIPDYDIINVLSAAGLATTYSRGDKRTVESTNNSEGNRRKELQEKMDKDLDTLASTLTSQLGDQMTDEMATYINKARAAVAADSSLITTWSKKHGFLNMHKKTGGEYTFKAVADKFFNEFNTLCQNNGKTSEEVAAEKAAAEQKAAQEKSAYQSMYNTSMSSVASEAGSNKNIQVVNVSSASEIQAKAQSDILNPIISKLTAKYAGQIPASELSTLLNNAATSALSDCTEWAGTANNYTYTIDANKLISRFDDAVKQSIKNKGYDF